MSVTDHLNRPRSLSEKALEFEPSEPGRQRILHVTGEYPDPIDSFKTPAIKALLDLTSDSFDHRVLSINRRSPRPLPFASELTRQLGRTRFVARERNVPEGLAISYEAPPYGIFHETKLRQLGDWIVKYCLRSEIPDLLVAHKLSIEGIAVRRAAVCLGVPFALSIQGDTDTKILAARPDLSGEFGRIFHGARIVFPFAPWALRKVEDRLGKRRGPVAMLPCATDLDQPLPPRSGGSGLVSIFHLKNRQRKNLRGMVAAMRLLEKQDAAPVLSIIGGGERRHLDQCRAEARGDKRIVFEGPLDRSALRHRLNRATAFILPSRRESFGLVFIEALLAGLPIIYPQDNAVDGYFDGFPFALRVDPKDSKSISEAIKKVIREEAQMKAALGEWQHSAHAEQFMRASIGQTFAQGLSVCLSGGR